MPILICYQWLKLTSKPWKEIVEREITIAGNHPRLIRHVRVCIKSHKMVALLKKTSIQQQQQQNHRGSWEEPQQWRVEHAAYQKSQQAADPWPPEDPGLWVHCNPTQTHTHTSQVTHLSKLFQQHIYNLNHRSLSKFFCSKYNPLCNSESIKIKF